jgi:hypothetical protein
MSERPDQSPASDKPPASTRYEDQDRTLRALHQLEHAASAPQGEDGAKWHRDLLEALTVLQEAMTEEQANAERPESLLSCLAHTKPRLRSRTRGTRVQYQQLRRTVAELRSDVAMTGALDTDRDDLRRRVARLASAVRYQRARESDLIYEAYYDTFQADIETEGTRAG